uniref:Uncharacterized protein n=1 Tax=Rangifer tarandus platyrhynchus TaxID=3082113 RepID=A0ACB0DXH9_RANTA|nr:unnamed protein product [Rangifer tarandus platyrhynchus]
MTKPASRRPCSMVSAPLSGAEIRAPGTPGDSGTRCGAPRPGASGNSLALHFGPAESPGSAPGQPAAAPEYPGPLPLAPGRLRGNLGPRRRPSVPESRLCSLRAVQRRQPAPRSRVSFRYIFGIPPLILVLLPVASSDCDINGKDGGAYQNVLMVNIDDLDNMINFDSNCLNNEPNFFKKHSCDDNKEASFLNRAARKLKQFLKMNISDDFKLHLSTVSQGTLTLLNCTSKGKGRKPPSLGEAQPTKNLEENKSLKEQKKQNDLCFLKILLQKIKTCWNKILRGIKEH